MDDVDRVAEFQAQLNQDAVVFFRNTTLIRRSAFFCIDCDCRIPESRRQACPGCLRCTECQKDIEGKR